ncbi:hypothetical protein [Chitinilyticum piscinae]|uniref:Uncharacterized protein n=1 Tax=Chitinilyticum piscinae TaxID=2866724 RepID=A0A8J7FGT3_9NEIS|nr:hypothetical protein [Chitinilyticum piscinae]MBE9609138.1 hypothetical protein [Chitinilyticum piscinae]
MPLVARLASPPEFRKLAGLYAAAGQSAPTLADMVLLAEEDGEIRGALRVVMARGLMRLDGVLAQDDMVLALLLQQAGRWIGREACWALASEAALPLYLAAGFVQQDTAPDTLRNEAAERGLLAVLRPVPADAESTEEIALGASGAAGQTLH